MSVRLSDAEIAELEKAVEARRKILKTIDSMAEGSDEETDEGFDDGKKDDTVKEKGILDALVAIMRKAGLKVHVNASKGQSVLNRENREGRRVRTLSAKKRRALETASLGNNPRSLTVVSRRKKILTLPSVFLPIEYKH